ncbi:hypothetical protein GH733_010482, partial [Mirounga leonina]
MRLECGEPSCRSTRMLAVRRREGGDKKGPFKSPLDEDSKCPAKYILLILVKFRVITKETGSFPNRGN